MARVTLTVEMKGIHSFEVPAFGYGTQMKYIYNMEGEDGTAYVWKTTAFWCFPIYEGIDPDTANFFDAKGKAYFPQRIVKGDKLVITATVKGQSEYKGQPQTELQRVKAVELVSHTKSWSDIQAEKEAEKKHMKKEQLESIRENDMVWTMPYKQYKEHYSDCETVIDSFEAPDTRAGRKVATISVIIREGRLKASGVRGRYFSGYEYEFTFDGKTGCHTFRAVCEENARKQLAKEFKGATDIELKHIYR